MGVRVIEREGGMERDEIIRRDCSVVVVGVDLAAVVVAAARLQTPKTTGPTAGCRGRRELGHRQSTVTHSPTGCDPRSDALQEGEDRHEPPQEQEDRHHHHQPVGQTKRPPCGCADEAAELAAVVSIVDMQEASRDLRDQRS